MSDQARRRAVASTAGFDGDALALGGLERRPVDVAAAKKAGRWSFERPTLDLSGVVDVYTNAGDKTAALGAAKDYEKSSESAHSAEVLAGTYYAKGDYKDAAKYYGIAADRSEKPARSTERAPYNDYMNLKREAESHL